MLAALAADAPEITAAITAWSTGAAGGGRRRPRSNVFNLAALLGLGAWWRDDQVPAAGRDTRRPARSVDRAACLVTVSA